MGHLLFHLLLYSNGKVEYEQVETAPGALMGLSILFVCKAESSDRVGSARRPVMATSFSLPSLMAESLDRLESKHANGKAQ